MDSTQLIVTILGAGGGGAVLLALARGTVKWLNGSAGRERARNTSLEAQRRSAVEERDAANRRADDESAKRRKGLEYASELRRELLENGLTPGAWPDFGPTLPYMVVKAVTDKTTARKGVE